MKTLADLKRDLQIGACLTLTGGRDARNADKLNVPRYVVTKQGNGVGLSVDKTATKVSFLELPKASLVEYDGETVRVYESGRRDLTELERVVLDNEPSKRPENKQQLENDMLSDGSQMYWADKRYHKELGTEYLEGHEMVRGLRYDFNHKNIVDEKIKGELSLEYKLTK